MGERRAAYRVLVGKSGGMRPFARPRPRWEDNIKIYIQELELGNMDWSDLARNRDRWLAVVNVVRTFGFHKMQGMS